MTQHKKINIPFWHDVIHHSLCQHRNLIQKVYLISESSLQFAIVLKHDTIDNEGEIIDIKIKYDQTKIAHELPLIFSFPTEKMMDNAEYYKILDLNKKVFHPLITDPISFLPYIL